MLKPSTERTGQAIKRAYDERTKLVFRRMDMIVTGKTLAASTSSFRADADGGVLTAYGPEYAFVAGNRGPGGMPPIDAIKEWLAERGLNIPAWAIAKKHAKEGSARRRRGERVVYEVIADEFLREDVPRLLREQARGLGAAFQGVHRTLTIPKR